MSYREENVSVSHALVPTTKYQNCLYMNIHVKKKTKKQKNKQKIKTYHSKKKQHVCST